MNHLHADPGQKGECEVCEQSLSLPYTPVTSSLTLHQPRPTSSSHFTGHLPHVWVKKQRKRAHYLRLVFLPICMTATVAYGASESRNNHTSRVSYVKCIEWKLNVNR